MKSGYDDIKGNEHALKPFIKHLVSTMTPEDVQEVLRSLNDAHTTEIPSLLL